MSKPRCYDVLGIGRTASSSEVRAAYRRGALRVHPDKGGCAEDFRQLVYAFEVLVDHDSRRRYDRQLVAEQSRDGLLTVGSHGQTSIAMDEPNNSKSVKASAPQCASRLKTQDVPGSREKHSHGMRVPGKTKAPAHPLQQSVAADTRQCHGASCERTHEASSKKECQAEPNSCHELMKDANLARDDTTADFDAVQYVEKLLGESSDSWPQTLEALTQSQLEKLKICVAQLRASEKQPRVARKSSGCIGSSFAKTSEQCSIAYDTELALVESPESCSDGDYSSSSEGATTPLMLCDDPGNLYHVNIHEDDLEMPRDSDMVGQEDAHACRKSSAFDRTRLRGLCKHKSSNRYFALIGLGSLNIRSQYSTSLDEAVNHHVLLSMIKSFAKRSMTKEVDPDSFEDSMRNAVASVCAADEIDGARLRIRCRAAVWSPALGRQFCSLFTYDINEALRARRILLDARDAGGERLAIAHAALCAEALEKKKQASEMTTQTKNAKKEETMARAEERREAKKRRLETRHANREARASHVAKQKKRRENLARIAKLIVQALASWAKSVKQANAKAKAAQKEARTAQQRDKQSQAELDRLLRHTGRTSLPEGIEFDEKECTFVAILSTAAGDTEYIAPRRKTITESEADLSQLKAAMARGNDACREMLCTLEIAQLSSIYGCPWE